LPNCLPFKAKENHRPFDFDLCDPKVSHIFVLIQKRNLLKKAPQGADHLLTHTHAALVTFVKASSAYR
jgi:hypothetical protein